MFYTNIRIFRIIWTWVIVGILIVFCGKANADFVFGEPVNLGPVVNSPSQEMSPSLSADGLSLYFASNRPGGSGEYDLWVTTRPNITEQWGPPENLGTQVNSEYSEMNPSISSDGLSLYFSGPHNGMGFGRPRPGGFARGDGGNIWVVTRPSLHDPWGTPVNLGPALNSTIYKQVVHPSISADGLSLYLHACDKGIGVANRSSASVPFETPEVLVFPGNHAANDWWPGISADERVMFFSVWNWNTWIFQLWITTRSGLENSFGPATKVPAPVNVSGSSVLCPNLSADGSILHYCSTQPDGLGAGDLWVAPIIPVVDFNGDGIVSSKDMCILINHWHTDNPKCDIGPAPWGDGIVDVQDLIVLSEHLFEQVNDPTLVVHWALDEIEGMFAADSAGDNDAVVLGGIEWQPNGGQIDGALQLDGVSGYAITDAVLNPADGSFSVIAWIKGGAPGQVVLSQTGGANWLCMDSVEGCLMTELKKDSGRLEGDPLLSDAIINDGKWHRIGFVWDGSCRHLYIDGVEVANDAEPLSGLNDANSGLNIGTGSNSTEGTFFSGLIDDVRIYNRAVIP